MFRGIIILLLCPILFMSGCASTGGIITPSYNTVNINLSLTTKPEKNAEIYIARGVGGKDYKSYEVAGYGKGATFTVTGYEEKKLLGTTPLTTKLTFRHYPIKGKWVWSPPAYKISFIELSGRESSFRFGTCSVSWADKKTGELKEVFYSKEFPLDFFVKHPFIRHLNVPYNFCLKLEE